MDNAVKFLGTSDEVDTCDCCGKKNLKSTVALSINEGEPVFYGVTCAARALKVGVKEIKAGTKAADAAKAATEKAVRDALNRAEDARWQTWLNAHSAKADRFPQIEELGGFMAARAAYEAASAA